MMTWPKHPVHMQAKVRFRLLLAFLIASLGCQQEHGSEWRPWPRYSDPYSAADNRELRVSEVESLMNDLDTIDKPVMIRALNHLIQHGHERLVQQTLQREIPTSEKTYSPRAVSASFVLFRLRSDPDAMFDLIVRALDSDKFSQARSLELLASQLDAGQDREYAVTLVPLLDSSDVNVRAGIVLALSRFPAISEVIPAIGKAATDPSIEVRYHAARAIAVLPQFRGVSRANRGAIVDALLLLLNDPQPAVRRQAAEAAVSFLQNRQVASKLRELARDPDLLVRDAAERALQHQQITTVCRFLAAFAVLLCSGIIAIAVAVRANLRTKRTSPEAARPDP